MTDLRKAAQAVLTRWDGKWDWLDAGPTADLMANLRAALAEPTVPSDCPNSHQPVQGPVAWMKTEGRYSVRVAPARRLIGIGGNSPVYAAPPQRQPLTDDAYRQLMKHAHRLANDGHGELAQYLRDAIDIALASETTGLDEINE